MLILQEIPESILHEDHCTIPVFHITGRETLTVFKLHLLCHYRQKSQDGKEASQITSLSSLNSLSLSLWLQGAAHPVVITGAENRMGWGLVLLRLAVLLSVPAAAAAPLESSWIFSPAQPGGLGENHENCCSHYTLDFHAHKCLIFSLTTVANAPVLLVKQKQPSYCFLYLESDVLRVSELKV